MSGKIERKDKMPVEAIHVASQRLAAPAAHARDRNDPVAQRIWLGYRHTEADLLRLAPNAVGSIATTLKLVGAIRAGIAPCKPMPLSGPPASANRGASHVP
jgi:hypothetical protein